MVRVIPMEELRRSAMAALFQGGHDAPLSIFVTEFPRGRGPDLHLHPYPEVFLVERNTALFTAGDEELTVTAGHFVIVPAETPHRYVGASDEPVRVVSVHPSPEVVQTNL